MQLKRFAKPAPVSQEEVKEEKPAALESKPAPKPQASTSKAKSLQLPSDLQNKPIIAKITSTLSDEELADVQRDPNRIIVRKSPHLLSREELIKEVEEKGSNSVGKKEYLKFLRGEPVSLKESQRAKCYDCMAWFMDGRADCRDVNCPSYPYFIYNKTDTSQRKRKNINPTWLHKDDDTNMDENDPQLLDGEYGESGDAEEGEVEIEIEIGKNDSVSDSY